jgi:hypothetical protein
MVPGYLKTGVSVLKMEIFKFLDINVLSLFSLDFRLS